MFINGTFWLKIAKTCTLRPDVFTTTYIHTQFMINFDPLEEPTSLKEQNGSNFVNFLRLLCH